jgi:hypothetical protein
MHARTHARTHVAAPLPRRPAPSPPPPLSLPPPSPSSSPLFPPPPPPQKKNISPTAFSSDNRFSPPLFSPYRDSPGSVAKIPGWPVIRSFAKELNTTGRATPDIFPISFSILGEHRGDYSEILGPGWNLSSPGQANTKQGGFHRC